MIMLIATSSVFSYATGVILLLLGGAFISAAGTGIAAGTALIGCL